MKKQIPHEPIWYGEDLSRKVRELSILLINEEYKKEETMKLVKEIKELTTNLESSLGFYGDILTKNEEL